MAQCKFCGKEIIWVKEGRRTRPVEVDGGLHQCEAMKSSLKSIKKIDPGSLSPDEIKKYEEGINKPKKK